MISIKYPWLLVLLVVVPLLVYFRYASWRKPTILFSEGRVLHQLPRSWAIRFSWLLPVLYAAALALIVFAISRPQRGLDESKVHTEAVDIVLLVDLSTSMRALDFSTTRERRNRLDAAKEVIREFIGSRPNDRIGIVAFAALPYTVAPLTLDHQWLELQLDRIKTGMLEDGTAIGDALASATNRLRESKAKSKLIILLTDGVNNAGSLTPENAAEAAKALDIKVYAVGAGKEGYVPFPQTGFMGNQGVVNRRSEIDEKTLKEIAKVTGGRFFRATDFKVLKDVYEEIDQMEKTEIEVEQFTRYEEVFVPFALFGLLLLALEKILSLTRIGRLA